MGALGFWKATGELLPKTREQRCWVHKTANILNKLPKSQQPKAKRMLRDIWMAETTTDAEAAFDAFVTTYAVKYDKAAECLKKDQGPLLAFYDFPAEHWKHLRTSNPIESAFATVRHRTTRSKGCLSNRTALAMVFKLVEGAQKTWRRLDGHNQLPKIIRGVKFPDGREVIAMSIYSHCSDWSSEAFLGFTGDSPFFGASKLGLEVHSCTLEMGLIDRSIDCSAKRCRRAWAFE